MSIPWEHIEGPANNHEVRLFALSTCGWCRKTRELLVELNLDHYYVYVDQLEGEEREEAVEEVKKWNSGTSFPTLVIDNETSIVGYEADRIRRELG
jgi:glutaredoxin